MASYRIICVGNWTIPSDDAGPRIYNELLGRDLPEKVDLIDGGLAGLDLIEFIPGTQRVVFVDALNGLMEEDAFIVLDRETTSASASDNYGHSAGLAYLLRVLPEIMGSALPEILVVGVNAQADDKMIASAADKCLSLALEGQR